MTDHPMTAPRDLEGGPSEPTREDLALLEACAREYEDSALACDTPSLRGFRANRYEMARRLRALASRLAAPSPVTPTGAKAMADVDDLLNGFQRACEMVVVRGDSNLSETTKARAFLRNEIRSNLLAAAQPPVTPSAADWKAMFETTESTARMLDRYWQQLGDILGVTDEEMAEASGPWKPIVEKVKALASQPPVTIEPSEMRTPEIVKDAWGDVEELAIDSGVDPRAWVAAVAKFWRVANLANEPVADSDERTDVDLLEPSLREELLALRDFAQRGFVLLSNLTDDDECERDHHGNCQTHHLERDCSVARARVLLDEYTATFDALFDVDGPLDSRITAAASLSETRDGAQETGK